MELKFKTIKESVSAQIVEKKSKFIANMFYIETMEEADRIIKEIKKKYHDARHNCYAYILETGEYEGLLVKYNDDGEPSGTAGAPMLNILANEGLSNVLVIVTRYFGGILLGTGGLVRAYSEAVKEALKIANFVEKTLGYIVNIEVEYNDLDKTKYYLKQKNIKIINIEYAENVILRIEAKKDFIEEFTNNVNNLNFTIIKQNILEEKNIEI